MGVISEWVEKNREDIENTFDGEMGEAFILFASSVFGVHRDSSFEAVLSAFRDSYYGEYKDSEEWARNYLNETSDIPEFIKYYIDYEAYADASGMSFIDNDNGNVFAFSETW